MASPTVQREDMQDVEDRIDRMTFNAGRAASPPDLRGAAQQAARPGVVPFHQRIFRGLLVAADGSPGADNALTWAAELGRMLKIPVTVTTVVPPSHALESMQGVPWGLHESEEESGREILRKSTDALRGAGLAPRAILANGPPGREVTRLARTEGADLVVVGGYGHGPLGRFLLGSVADSVKDQAAGSVLIAKTRPRASRVLIATDGSGPSKRAAALGLSLARMWNVPATILHAVAPPSFGPLERGRRTFDYAFENLQIDSWQRSDVEYKLEFGTPAEKILEAADKLRAGLIVMGSRGLTGLERLGAGSVSNRVAHEARASVMLVRDVGFPEEA